MRKQCFLFSLSLSCNHSSLPVIILSASANTVCPVCMSCAQSERKLYPCINFIISTLLQLLDLWVMFLWLLGWCCALERLIEPCEHYRGFGDCDGENLFYNLQYTDQQHSFKQRPLQLGKCHLLYIGGRTFNRKVFVLWCSESLEKTMLQSVRKKWLLLTGSVCVIWKITSIIFTCLYLKAVLAWWA